LSGAIIIGGCSDMFYLPVFALLLGSISGIVSTVCLHYLIP